MLNRASPFQVLFSGKSSIDIADVFLSIMSEKKSWAYYFVYKAEIEKDKFKNTFHSEISEVEEEDVDPNNCPQSTESIHNPT